MERAGGIFCRHLSCSICLKREFLHLVEIEPRYQVLSLLSRPRRGKKKDAGTNFHGMLRINAFRSNQIKIELKYQMTQTCNVKYTR